MGKDSKPKTSAGADKSVKSPAIDMKAILQENTVVTKKKMKAIQENTVVTQKKMEQDAVKLREKRIDDGIAFYKRKGRVEEFIHTLRDLTKKKKAEMYEDIMIRVKGSLPKNNPWLAMIFAVVLSMAMCLPAHAATKVTNYPNGFPNGVTIQNLPILNSYAGNVWWVDSGAGSDGGKGTFTAPFASIDYAVGRCAANNGDVIMLKAGHAENLSTADAIDADVAGITIVGVGNGSDMATLTYTGTAGEFVVGAANVTVANVRFVPGISNITMGISVEAGGDSFRLLNCEVPESGTATYDFADFIDLASGADDIVIDGMRFNQLATTAGDLDHFLEAGNGVNKGITVINSSIHGEFAVSAIWSDTADTLVRIENCTITNATNGQHAVEFTSTAAGVIKDCLLRTNADATDLDPGSLTISNVYWDDDTTADTAAFPSVLASEGAGSVGGINDTTTDTLHGKLGTDTEMSDNSMYDLLVASPKVLITKSAITSSSIPNNTQTAGAITGAAGCGMWAEEIVVQCDGTGFAEPTNIEITTDNAKGPTGADGTTVCTEVIASFGANARMQATEDCTSEELPIYVESGKKLYIHGDDAAGTGAGVCDVIIRWTADSTDACTITGNDLP